MKIFREFTNSYLLKDKEGNTVLIDPGLLEDWKKYINLKEIPDIILLTHDHYGLS